MIYLLTVNYYSSSFITKLVQSLSEEVETAYKLVIVNNSRRDGDLRNIKSLSGKIEIIEVGANLGFAKACNIGLNWIYARNTEAVVWLLNPDTQLLPNMIEKVMDFFQHHCEVSILGTLIYTPQKKIWFAGGDFKETLGAITVKTHLSNRDQKTPYFPCNWITGCSMVLNFKKFPRCPQFDSTYFLYYEDFDFCQRCASDGHLIALNPHIHIIHEVSALTNLKIIRKFKHSTYSYLITLERYTTKTILWTRFFFLCVRTLILLPLKPKVAWGKKNGILLYLKNISR